MTADTVWERLPIIPGARRSSFQDAPCLTASLPEYTGPKSKAGILASGLVTIVKTPAEVKARIEAASEGWKVWQSDRFSSVREMRTAMNRALAPVKAPAMPHTVAELSAKAAQNEAKKYGAYMGGKRFTPPHAMSPAALKQALAREARRLAGYAEDGVEDFTVEAGLTADLVEAA